MQPTLYRLCPALSPTPSPGDQVACPPPAEWMGWAPSPRPGQLVLLAPQGGGEHLWEVLWPQAEPPFGAAMPTTQKEPAYREKRRDRCTGTDRENETTIQRGKPEEGLLASFPPTAGAGQLAIVCCTSSLSLLQTPLSLNLIGGSSCPLQQNYPTYMVRALPPAPSKAGMLRKPCPLLSL